jgi:hypothetical protein
VTLHCSPLARTLIALTALTVCTAPLLAQAQNCASPNTDADYILGVAGNTGSAMHWTSGLVWKRCLEGQSFGNGQCTGTALAKEWNIWASTDAFLPQSFTNQATWSISAGLSQNLLHSGGWRMAYLNEVKAITANCSAAPKVNRVVFPDTPATSGVWSGSPLNGGTVTGLSYNSGSDYNASNNSSTSNLRLVRGGQSFAALTSPAAQTVAANAQATFAAIALAPSTGTGQAWGGVRISGAGNPQFQVNGGAWVEEAIVQGGDQIAVRLTAPAAGGSHKATLALRSGLTTGTTTVTGGNGASEATAMMETTADFTLTALAPPAAAPSIPTLGEWAMLLLASLLGLLGLGVLRQRNRPSIHL